jgi:hypothetical protein
MMMAKRIGNWAWTLSADERVTAAIMDAARGDTAGISVRVRRAHEVMQAKQKKVLARQPGAGAAAPRRSPGPRF